MRVGEVGIDGDRGIEARERLLRLPEPPERKAEQIVRARLPGIDREQTPYQPDAFDDPVLPAVDLCKMVERIRIRGIAAQHLDINVRGFVQRALALKRTRLIEQLVDGRIHFAPAIAVDRPEPGGT